MRLLSLDGKRLPDSPQISEAYWEPVKPKRRPQTPKGQRRAFIVEGVELAAFCAMGIISLLTVSALFGVCFRLAGVA